LISPPSMMYISGLNFLFFDIGMYSIEKIVICYLADIYLYGVGNIWSSQFY
jgi:hypothetical protein